MLDNALELRMLKPRSPAHPLLVWSFLFHWLCVRERALQGADAGWFLTFVVMFLFARDENRGNSPWWAFIPWVTALLLICAWKDRRHALFKPSARHNSLTIQSAGEFLLFIFLCIVFLSGKRRPD